jgi:hypothetical protein
MKSCARLFKVAMLPSTACFEEGQCGFVTLRADLNYFNDILLQHMLVLCNVRGNYLTW